MTHSMNVNPPEPTPKVFVRSGLMYTSCYCEENIYCMVRDIIDPPDRKNYIVIFISNEEKCSPLFYQKAASHPKVPVCWDYHVILIHKPATANPSSTVYDFDTTLDPFGLPFETYFSKTLYGEGLWTELDLDIDQRAMLSFVDRHPRLFKLIPAEDYLKLFASTRKHMMKRPPVRRTSQENESLDVGRTSSEIRRWEDQWLANPPDYPPIRTEESDDNLDKFLDFGQQSGSRYGRILDERGFWQEFTGTINYTSLVEINQVVEIL